MVVFLHPLAAVVSVFWLVFPSRGFICRYSTHVSNPEQLQNLGNDKPNEFVFISHGGNEIWSPQQQNLPTLAELRNYHLGTTEGKSEEQQNNVLSTATLTEQGEPVLSQTGAGI